MPALLAGQPVSEAGAGGMACFAVTWKDLIAHRGLICLARKRGFVRWPAANWHDGQISQNLSSPSRKNIPLSFSPKSVA
jgi:hypothetical protein